MFYTATILSLDTLTSIIYVATLNERDAPVWLLGEMIAHTRARHACEFLVKEKKMISALSHITCPFCQAIYMTFVR